MKPKQIPVLVSALRHISFSFSVFSFLDLAYYLFPQFTTFFSFAVPNPTAYSLAFYSLLAETPSTMEHL